MINDAKGVVSQGLVTALSADKVREMEAQREREARTVADSPPIQALASHISHAFTAAQNHRNNKKITEDLNTCQRLRAGIYEPSRLAEIQKQGGSTTFFNETETKCASLEAWLQDIMSDFQFSLEPTPIPDLPDNIRQQVIEMALERWRASGAELNPQVVQQITLDLYDQAEREAQIEARKRAEQQQQIIEDQLVEGDWKKTLFGVFNDLATYTFAVLKGPVLQSRTKLTWQSGEPVVNEAPIPVWRRVSPHDMYFGPSCTSVNDSYLCEVLRFDRGQLIKLKDVEGWNAELIDLALRDKSTTSTNIDTGSRSDIEHRVISPTDGTTGAPDALVEAVEYWGGAEGKTLIEWGMKGPIDDKGWHEITAVMIGPYVVRAIMNPDPLGRRPYHITSVEKCPDSPVGRALPLMMRYCQDSINATTRALVNNIALSSGPQVRVDLSSIRPGTDIATVFPMKVWPFSSEKLMGRVSVDPVGFFQPQLIAGELIGIIEHFKNVADDATRIPRYSYGNSQTGGAGETASGLNMLMNAASKGIRRIVANIDNDIIASAIKMLHAWNMLYNEKYPKGDACVVPRGAIANMIKEQVSIRRQEFLAATNNPTDMAIIGIEGRAAVLRETAKLLDMPTEDIVPDAQKLRMRAEEMMQQQQEQGEGAEEVAA